MTRYSVALERRDFGRGIGMLVFASDPSGIFPADHQIVGLPVQFTKREDGVGFIEPTMSFDMSTAQTLMDELWRCGLRPSEGTGSAGALAATQAHLKDMRSIALGLLQGRYVESATEQVEVKR